jgi:DNA-binding SARP family transcriptional activator
VIAPHSDRAHPRHPADNKEFFLFGRFKVRVGDQEIPGLGSRKVQELLAYLILVWERAHHRETLAETLWGGDTPGSEPKKHLRQALWQLRQALRHTNQKEPILLVDSEWLQVNRGAGVWADVWDFEQSLSDTRGISGEALSEGQVLRLRRGADLYRADLLEGWYTDWFVYERERLRNLYLHALDKLLAHSEAHGLTEDGLFYGERILAHDRAHESTHWRMMRLHLLAGDRTRALRQFDRCVVALREELDIEPSGSLIVFREQIRSDTLVLSERQ